MNPKVDFFFDKEKKWQKEFILLRQLILSCGLEEVLKWGQACYTHNGNNIVLIHGFKEYCALLFFKGTLLKTAPDLMVQQTKNVQAARQVRFTNAAQITKLQRTLKALVYEAIEVEKAGLKVKFRESAEYEMPEAFKTKLAKMPGLKKAFYALTPGRQRGYLLHFAAPKQEKTREARIEKFIPHILAGKGLNDE